MVFNNSILLGAAGQGGVAPFDTTLIPNSVWFDSGDYFSQDSAASDSGRKEAIFSTWIQRTKFNEQGMMMSVNGSNANDYLVLDFQSDNTLRLLAYSTTILVTTQVFRDIGWYHILVTIDTSQNSDASQRIFINGEEVTSFSTRNNFGSSADIGWGRNQTHLVNSSPTSVGSNQMIGYMAQTALITDKSFQQGDYSISDFLDTQTFGTNGSQFIPKKNSDIATIVGAGGNNSFFLNYETSSDLGNDGSSKNNDFTANSMAAANQSENTPSNTYATWNAIFGPFAGHTHTATLTEGGLRLASSTSNYSVTTSSLAMPAGSGKFAAKFTVNTLGGIYPVIGVYDMDGDTSSAFTGSSDSVGLRMDGEKYVDGSSSSYGSAVSAGNTVEVELDMDNNTVEFLINGSAQGTISKTFTGTVVFMVQDGSNGSAIDVTAEFDYTPDDANFKNLNTANLTTPDYQGIDYFDATIYEGNGRVQRVGDFVPFTDSETVANSVIFNDDDSAYLDRTYGTPTSAKKFTVSFWFKAGAGTGDQYLLSTGSGGGAPDGNIYLNHSTGNGELWYADPNDGSGFGFRTARKFTDSSSWVHFCMGIDTTASSGSRLKVEIDGVDQGQPSATAGSLLQNNQGGSALPTEPSLNQDMNLNKDSAVYNIGRRTLTSGGPLDGYLANYYFIDGEKKQASDFGQLDTSTNRWVPKAYSGNFNDNGWKLAFGTAPGTGSGAGTDTSGEGHNWTENNFNSTDQSADTPSKNFNVFDSGLNGAGTLSEGNTQIVTATNTRTTYTTMNIPATGKWYWEVDVVNYTTNGSVYIGVVEFDELVTGNDPINGLTRQVIFDNYAGNAYIYSNSSGDNLGTTWCNTPGNNNFNADGDILQFALDQDAGTLFIGNNNTWFRAGGARDTFANATTVGQRTFKTGVKRRFLLGRGGSNAETYALNFGQHPNTFSGSSTTFNAAADGYFVYTPPTGYKAVNQDNLDDTASKITAWSWIKNRDATDSHILVDRIRGVGKTVTTDTTTTTPETTNINTVQRFLQRGVQVGSDVQVNTANESYVLWQWLVGDSATTGTSIGAGSISTGVPSLASTVLAADAGHFSVVSWTGSENHGDTIGHGMGGEPEFIIAIARAESGQNKPVYHKFMTSDFDHLKINDNGPQGTASSGELWDISAMSSTLIGLGDIVQSNSSNGMIAYCFRSIPGVCKVGKYIGNGDTTETPSNGPYVNLGFKPRWIMVRSLAGSRNWNTLDTARNPTNIASPFVLLPNSTAVDTAGQIGAFDILADGFKPRDTAANSNASGETYIYLAMADIGGNGTLPPIYGR